MLFGLDISAICGILISVMREEFKPKKEELLRKAWKKEWMDMDKAIGEDGELVPSWETFKRMKQRTKFIPKKNDWLRGPWENENA